MVIWFAINAKTGMSLECEENALFRGENPLRPISEDANALNELELP
jgi:hypothetical protein